MICVGILLFCVPTSTYAQEVETQEENRASCSLLQKENNQPEWRFLENKGPDIIGRPEVIYIALWYKAFDHGEVGCSIFLARKIDGVEIIKVQVHKSIKGGGQYKKLIDLNSLTLTRTKELPWQVTEDEIVRLDMVAEIKNEIPKGLYDNKTLFMEYVAPYIETFPNQLVRSALEEIAKKYNKTK
ncbi:MAG: hypothetical protein RIQ54_265 [Candidatus Parcubacteria bacterium]